MRNRIRIVRIPACLLIEKSESNSFRLVPSTGLYSFAVLAQSASIKQSSSISLHEELMHDMNTSLLHPIVRASFI